MDNSDQLLFYVGFVLFMIAVILLVLLLIEYYRAEKNASHKLQPIDDVNVDNEFNGDVELSIHRGGFRGAVHNSNDSRNLENRTVHTSNSGTPSGSGLFSISFPGRSNGRINQLPIGPKQLFEDLPPSYSECFHFPVIVHSNSLN